MNTMSLSKEQAAKLTKLKENFKKFEQLAESFNEDVDALGHEYNFNEHLTERELKAIVDKKSAERIDLYKSESKQDNKS